MTLNNLGPSHCCAVIVLDCCSNGFPPVLVLGPYNVPCPQCLRFTVSTVAVLGYWAVLHEVAPASHVSQSATAQPLHFVYLSLIATDSETSLLLLQVGTAARSTVLSSAGGKSLKDNIVNVFGSRLADGLTPLTAAAESGCSLVG